MNVKCSQCGKDHQLVRRIGKTKSDVGYFCDKTPTVAHNKNGEVIAKNHLAFVVADFTDELKAESLREVLTPAAKKQIQLKSQLQFVMTYPDKDLMEIAKYQQKLDELIAMRGAIRAQILVLEKEIVELNSEANTVSAKLAEKQTFKLNM
jgi:vacuolar-type H+-ATPase subunit I/STV1